MGNLAYLGKIDEALQVVQAIRARYDGERRNPFDEAECGHHYARAMASWGLVLALTGFSYSAVERRVRFARAAAPVRWFWSTGGAWGSSAQRPIDGGVEIAIQVRGAVAIATIAVAEVGEVATGNAGQLHRGDERAFVIG